MRNLRSLLLVAVVLNACGPRVEVHAERSQVAFFPRYGTYAWTRSAAPARSAGETEASLLDWRIRQAVDRGLAAKGYVRTEAAASLLTDYDVATRASDTEGFREYFRFRRGGGTKDIARGYEEGTVVVHLVDARTHDLAYRASATGVIEEGGDRDRLEKAIARMLADLPQATSPATGRR